MAEAEDLEKIAESESQSNIEQWGILQYIEEIDEAENGQAKADALLKLYNKKTRTLEVTNCLGDVRCRAGTMPIVKLNLGEMEICNYMIVDKATHTFENGKHTMTLIVRGGEISG